MTAPTHPSIASTAAARDARRVGLAYLGIVLCGLYAEFFVRMSLVTSGDASGTARAIAGARDLFLSGVAADALMIALDVVVGIGLYRLLRHVDDRLAAVALVARLLQAAVLAANLANPLRALDRATASTGAEAGAAGQALAAMESHALLYDVGLIAFAVSCLAVARLLHASGVAPRLLPAGMAATGLVYLVGSSAALFAPSLSTAIDPLYGVAIVVEPAFALWLVRRGRRLAPGDVRTRRDVAPAIA